MKLAIAGLGKMGFNMARRLLEKGHNLFVYNRSLPKVEEAQKLGAKGFTDFKEMISSMRKESTSVDEPVILWLMMPAGDVTRHFLDQALLLLEPGDYIIEGANSRHSGDPQNFQAFKEKKINYMDAGVSGGIWGYSEGYCLMIGGEKQAYLFCEPLFRDLAPKNGYLFCGPAGTGHFVKMVHNGIEYAMMQSYAEGFELLEKSPYGRLDLKEISGLWNQGSVVRSWLLELLAHALELDPDLSRAGTVVPDSGEGRWTVEEAVKLGVSAPAISAALFKRFDSQNSGHLSNRILAMLRNSFGGHDVIRE
jgi:6-phosphogluconate dehydrogenase